MKQILKTPALACVLMLVLFACAKTPVSNNPAPPNSPQALVLNADKTLADANNAAVKLVIALRDQGKVSQATTSVIESWCASVAMLDDSIATELGSADTWAAQKQKILLLLAGFALPPVIGNLDPTLQSDLAVIGSLLTQIQGQVNQ